MKQSIFFIILIISTSIEVFSFGSIEESNITYPVEERYISPANQDGVNDTITLSFSQNITPAKGKKLEKVFFRVYNSRGSIVFEEEGDIASIDSYVFDGKDESGNYLPDGAYVYTIGSIDNKGNVTISQPYPIVIDNTAPDIIVAEFLAGNLASFNGGIPISIEVDATPEIIWQYIATDENGKETIIYNQRSKENTPPPEKWEWLALNSDDKLIEDGNYTIDIMGQDRAGNTNRYSISIVAIVSQDGAVKIEPVDSLVFSPNRDGAKDMLGIKNIFPSNGAISPEDFDEWAFVLKSQSDEELFSMPIAEFKDVNYFTGYFIGMDEEREVVADGTYKLSIRFGRKGEYFTTNALLITVDTEYPKAAAFLNTSPSPVEEGDSLYFGGETRDRIVGSFKALDALPWNIALYKEVHGDRQLLLDRPITLSEDNTYLIDIGVDFTWEDKKLEDGFYTMDFYAIDDAGNRGGVTDVSFVRDTGEKIISVATNKDAVSPFASPLSLIIDYTNVGIKDFMIQIMNKGGREFVSHQVKNRGEYNYEWDAKASDGTVVEDGEYEYKVSIQYYNGVATSANGRIVVDSIPPQLTDFNVSSELINPKETNAQNSMLKVTQSTDSSDAEWSVEIKNIFEQSMYSEDQGALLKNIEWTGKDAENNFVPDGDYIYLLTGRDLAGNMVERSVPFIVDTGSYNSGKSIGIDDDMPMIFFPAFSRDLFSYDKNELLYENLLNIRSVARLLRGYPDYKLTIKGHAAALLKGTNRESREQTEVLIPLSKERADQIKRAILILGIEEERIIVVAVGGKTPFVTEPTKDDIWKNRRVEFLITKE